MGCLNQARQQHQYRAVEQIHKEKQYPIRVLCEILKLNRSSYYKWLGRKKSVNECQNESLIPLIQAAYDERNGILGYRQMTIKLNREHHKQFNHKRIYRLMRLLGLKSVCRKKRYNYIKSNPEIVAENILDRNFTASRPCQKWLADVTELKYGNGQKAYLSAILDLGDRSIPAYVLGRSNNNDLVFKTFDNAIHTRPNAKPIFHSDRGFQYTSKVFRNKLNEAGMIQSMSRVGRCLDNAPMEGFWGFLKSEMFYLHTFDTFDDLEIAVHEYMDYYNNRRYQKRLQCMTPMEFQSYIFNAA